MTHVGINFAAVLHQQDNLVAKIPGLSSEILDLKLVAVEQGGIWFENQHLTDGLLREMGKPSLERTLIVFVPYSAIQWAIVLGEGTSLSAEKLGL